MLIKLIIIIVSVIIIVIILFLLLTNRIGGIATVGMNFTVNGTLFPIIITTNTSIEILEKYKRKYSIKTIIIYYW